MSALRTVGEVAAITGTTVRTLHHYDEIGLLEPSVRSATGYRLYADADIVRLHSILHWRTLGLGLDEIAGMIDAPDQDLAAGLERQLERVRERAADLAAMIDALESALSALDEDISVTDDMMRRLFDGFDPAEHHPEVEQRWGDTDSHREARRRVATYAKADWERYKNANDANVETFANLMGHGVSPDEAEAVEAARVHGELIDEWFYPVDAATHLGLAESYVTDSRFEAAYERVAAGLARYVRDAVVALHRTSGG